MTINLILSGTDKHWSLAPDSSASVQQCLRNGLRELLRACSATDVIDRVVSKEHGSRRLGPVKPFKQFSPQLDHIQSEVLPGFEWNGDEVWRGEFVGSISWCLVCQSDVPW